MSNYLNCVLHVVSSPISYFHSTFPLFLMPILGFFYSFRKDAHESSLSRRKEDLWGLEKKLQEGQRRLSASEELQNKRESRLNVSHRILTQREMDLEVSRRKITEADYLELKEKEAAIIARLADFEARETVRDACLCSSSSLLFFKKILNGCAVLIAGS